MRKLKTVTSDHLQSFIDFMSYGGVNPDTTLSAEERDIGGLGIYMVKKSMDDIAYEYKDGHNILKIKKNLS